MKVLLHYSFPSGGFFQIALVGEPNMDELEDVGNLCELSIDALKRKFSPPPTEPEAPGASA